jgi:phosphoglycerol transferase MdoB-like AlkP superfamily enzyme
MERETTRPGVRGSLLLSHRDLVYLLSLLVPFVLYDLVLKVLLIASWPEDPGFLGALGLMRSDFLFNLGYGLLWVGLFAVTRRKLYRRIVVVLLHVATVFVALITTGSYQYFQITGSILDSDYILFWLASPEGTGGAILSQVTPGRLALILIVLAYATFGPLLVTRLVVRWRRWPESSGLRSSNVAWLRLAGVGLAAYALFALSMLPSNSVRSGNSLSRDAVVNMVMTAAQVAESDGLPDVATEQAAEEPSPEVRLRPTAGSERRNVVLIFLESTRALATTPYNEDLKTTPFLNELSKKSLMAERAYAVVPHTHNALTATNCGIEPPMDRWGTLLLGARSDSVPSACLADLLQEQGYNSAYFMSQASTFENSPKILENLGYEEFYSVEGMDKEGFEQTNYFGYEDEIMLEPSKEWLQQQKESGEPFLATYLTSAPHHEYRAPQQRHGRLDFSEDDTVNRYLNSVRNEDFFLRELFEQYKELGLYDDTVFVVLGDHGEGFGEHDRYQHDNVPYEEGLKIPLLVHDPRRFEDGARLKAPVNQLDVLPTVADLLGYEIEGGSYEGSSLLGPLPTNRPLKASCWNESGCLVSIRGTGKYIYHFGSQAEEVFDLSEDPNERRNLAGGYGSGELEKQRTELLEWRARVNSNYGMGVSEDKA